jgi:hypothetical protein
MRCMRTCLIVFLIALAAGCTPLSPYGVATGASVTVYTRDGRSTSGEERAQNEDALYLDSNGVGTIPISRDEIVRVSQEDLPIVDHRPNRVGSKVIAAGGIAMGLGGVAALGTFFVHASRSSGGWFGGWNGCGGSKACEIVAIGAAVVGAVGLLAIAVGIAINATEKEEPIRRSLTRR